MKVSALLVSCGFGDHLLPFGFFMTIWIARWGVASSKSESIASMCVFMHDPWCELTVIVMLIITSTHPNICITGRHGGDLQGSERLELGPPCFVDMVAMVAIEVLAKHLDFVTRPHRTHKLT